MRRTALLSVALTLALASSAAAAPSGSLTVAPRTPGAGTVATLDLRLTHAMNPVGIVAVQVARGTRFRKLAVARRCRNRQARADDCPAGSGIGGGTAEVETEHGVLVPIDIDLYLAPRRRAEDAAGLVWVTRAAGNTGYGTGRAFELNPQVYPDEGLQLTLERLRAAFFNSPVRRLNLQVGAHRTVDGHRVDLLTNPSECAPRGWPWMIAVKAPDGSASLFHGSIDCSG